MYLLLLLTINKLKNKSKSEVLCIQQQLKTIVNHLGAMDTSIDWQTSCHELKDRGEHLLKSGKWADCHFLVGAEPNQIMLPGHKLIMAMASPVSCTSRFYFS